MSKFALMKKLNAIAKQNHVIQSIENRNASGIETKFKGIFVAIVLILVLVLFVAGIASTFISTTNSLTTGATPVIGGGGAAIINQAGLFIGIAIGVLVLGIAFVALDAILGKGRK